MAENYILLESIELSQSASSVTFDNLPSTGYTDLKIVGSSRSTTTNDALLYRLNGTTTGYTGRWVGGTGTAPESGTFTTLTAGAGGTWGRVSNAGVNGSGYTSNAFSNWEMYIPNYTSADYKSISVDSFQENNATLAYMDLDGLLWSNTASITSIAFAINGSGAFVAGSTFSLYGLAATGTTPVTAPFASGGNIVANDGTYWYHAFLSSGTFTPFKALTCDYLVVAGGGGGGATPADNAAGGGGGAGGLRSTVTSTGGGGSLESALSLIAQAYTVTIGAGGAAGSTNGTTGNGINGSNSVFSTITSTGGGGGAGADSIGTNKGLTGGSAGGNRYSGGTGTAGTTNQGFAGGGHTVNSSNFGAAGGGGAGAVGVGNTTASRLTGGAGGAGVAISTFASATNTGVSNYYAGGGGGAGYLTSNVGGAGGAGGGGAGSTGAASNAVAGTANTGGGGGGGGAGSPTPTGPAAAGGSGIVIVRYAMV
jgi:hypothetical protein